MSSFQGYYSFSSVVAIAAAAVALLWFLFSKRENQATQVDATVTHNNTEPSTSASASSVSPGGGVYEVFLSFYGKDTRKGFTDFLYTYLVGASIKTFRDDNELRVGKKISSELLNAIAWSSPRKDFKLIGYADSDWAVCLDDRKNTTGSVFNLGSSAITWSSKKHDTVPLSFSKAEYIAAGLAARQAIWLRKMLDDLCCRTEEATKLWCDNQSTIAMTKNPIFHAKKKHIELQHHYIRKLVLEGKVMLRYYNTNEQAADVLTKPLSEDKTKQFMKNLGMCKFESRGGVKI